MLFVQGRIGVYANLVESALHRFEGDEELTESLEIALVQLDLLERVAGSEYPAVQRTLAIAEGDAAREREVLDKGFSSNLLESNAVVSLLSEYPDYDKLMKKNQ